MFERLITATIDAISDVARSLTQKFFPAEPFWVPLTVVIPAVIGSVLNGQIFNLRQNFDLNVYGIGIASTGVFDFMLRDSTGSVNYMTAQLRSTTITSAAGIGPWFPLYRPWKVKAGTDITADFTNQIAGENTVQIVLLCWKSVPQAGAQ